ncbi:MAG: hypothetical protein Q9183_000803 [Haloplaca sp. 2 TL-2023]
MSSSLPYDVGARKSSSKPTEGSLKTLKDRPPNTSHGSKAPGGSSSGRKRATTTVSATPGSLLDRRSKTGNSQLQAPISVPKLPVGLDVQTSSAPVQPITFLDQGDERRSAPIAIPIRKPPQSSHPVTPLTGRERSFFPHVLKDQHTPPKERSDKDFTPSPDSQSQAASSQSEQEQFAPSPVNRRNMRTDRSSPMCTPSSPLSPTMPHHTMPSFGQHKARTLSGNQHGSRQSTPLAIPSLPPYHPANYESRQSSPRLPPSSSSAHARQVSELQKNMQRHQRALLINATRAAATPTTGKPPAHRPSSPRLNPMSSPGPITPLMLEGQTDYFLGGPNTSSASRSKAGDRREMVDNLVNVERERIRHPRRDSSHSPAVSPAA